MIILSKILSICAMIFALIGLFILYNEDIKSTRTGYTVWAISVFASFLLSLIALIIRKFL